MAKEKVGSRLAVLPSEALKVYVALQERAQCETRVGLTENELARTCGLSSVIIFSMLQELIDMALIEHVQDGGKRTIIIDGIKIPYSAENTDDTRLSVLEEELRRISKNRTEKSGLENFYRNSDVGNLILEIENRGWALTVNEAFLLGQAIQKFGPKRVQAAYRQMRRAKNPIPAVWASLQNGMKGQGAKEQESVPFVEVKTRYLNDPD